MTLKVDNYLSAKPVYGTKAQQTSPSFKRNPIRALSDSKNMLTGLSILGTAIAATLASSPKMSSSTNTSGKSDAYNKALRENPDLVNKYSKKIHDNEHDFRTFFNYTDYGIVKINEIAKQDKNKAIKFANFIENKWDIIDLTPNQIDYLAEKFDENPDIAAMFKDFSPRDKVYLLKSCEKEPEATKALYSQKNSMGYPLFGADDILMLVDTYKKYPDRVNDLIEESKKSDFAYDAADIISKVYDNRLNDMKIKDYPGYSYLEEIENSIK